MKAVKVKVLAIETSNKPVLVDETKPDKRYTLGYRKTGNKIARIVVNTTLITSYSPELRLGAIVLVSGFGKMRVIDIQKDGDIRLINIERSFVETYKISLKLDEYVDVAPLGFMYSEGSSR